MLLESTSEDAADVDAYNARWDDWEREHGGGGEEWMMDGYWEAEEVEMDAKAEKTVQVEETDAEEGISARRTLEAFRRVSVVGGSARAGAGGGGDWDDSEPGIASESYAALSGGLDQQCEAAPDADECRVFD